jgi:hypothetical protein
MRMENHNTLKKAKALSINMTISVHPFCRHLNELAAGERFGEFFMMCYKSGFVPVVP